VGNPSSPAIVRLIRPHSRTLAANPHDSARQPIRRGESLTGFGLESFCPRSVTHRLIMLIDTPRSDNVLLLSIAIVGRYLVGLGSDVIGVAHRRHSPNTMHQRS